jgi:hypothetical protein
MERGFRNLDQRIEVYLDGVRAELPSIESVVVLNIPSWGAGVDLWNMGAGMMNISVHSWEMKNYYPYENMVTISKCHIKFVILAIIHCRMFCLLISYPKNVK